MQSVPTALRPWLLILPLGAALLAAAIAAPQTTVRLLPVLVLIPAALLLYEYPIAFAVLLIATYGLGIDFELDRIVEESGGGSGVGTLGAAVLKVLPFALAAMLTLRYGLARAINWPFLAFTAIAAVSLVVLPIGRVSTFGEMARSFIGSTAPFVLAFAAGPRRIWDVLCKGATAVPILSAVGGILYSLVGPHFAIDPTYTRFMGMHNAPFLAGFCVTAIFACTLEYLRGFRTVWLLVGAADMVVLFATQARAPLVAVMLFLLLTFLVARGRTFPLKRKVDLVMGGMVPGLVVLGPAFLYALSRFVGKDGDFNYSGRDVIWPYFLDAIETRPLFGYGLGAGKLIVDPEDPRIKLIRSNAAHNEYLRLSVDAGIVGCAAIFLAIIAWVWGGTRRAAPAEKVVLRCALIAALLHSGFDNTLIASTSVVQFVWFAAALARARAERPDRAAASGHHRRASGRSAHHRRHSDGGAAGLPARHAVAARRDFG